MTIRWLCLFRLSWPSLVQAILLLQSRPLGFFSVFSDLWWILTDDLQIFFQFGNFHSYAIFLFLIISFYFTFSLVKIKMIDSGIPHKQPGVCQSLAVSVFYFDPQSKINFSCGCYSNDLTIFFWADKNWEYF